ncbi:D-sedoheptulose 7-phosphate isomerase [Granulibacter bethesdensis]|uniref:Phosphoheptose isomerase n=1 Tax=Granulibacter bethesdensis TaxID=364410 RepID=A0AAN0REE9_9PROT|nr:D-sedoheptulose 7-phosphate isomerase [Granulibacter bethesdensis]AHJ63419.1 Phosphoheptose isomerase [Granulibacter bethesdensis]AHJ68633.1 Phosphoheptose isomerase [Granulibacter bethesdensis]
MDHRDFLTRFLDASCEAMDAFAADEAARETLIRMGEDVCTSIRNGGKLLIAGNGGSAADAQHIAAEFVSRLMYDRAPLPALALTTDSSALTAIGNDYGYEHVFERQVTGLGQKGDVFLGISTSGRSPNVIRALQAAREKGIITFGFTGVAGNAMTELCDRLLLAPSPQTAIIQQIHITAAHMLCAVVERTLFPVEGR